MKKIGITTSSFGEYDKEVLSILQNEGFEVMLNPYGRKLTGEEVVKLCEGASGIIAGTEKLGAEIFGKLKLLRVVSRCGAGIDNVDTNSALRFGIKVFNTPDAPTVAVAELTVGLILNLLRKISRMDAAIRRGEWRKSTGNLLFNKKVGIVGFGRIGKSVAQLLKSFSCEIVYTDPKAPDTETRFKRLPFDELLKCADIISIHASSANKIITARELSLIKKGAWVINVSRGEIIDEEALYRNLVTGHLSGAALDVYAEEPYYGPLKELDNILLTPHIGSYAIEARVDMEKQAVRNLLIGLKSG